MEKIIKFLTSFKLACVLLLLLFLHTWFMTLEQVDNGLYASSLKYFSWKSLYVIPDFRINGKLLPIILPGAYWVCVALFINMLAGGVIKIRKGWKKIGVIISHFGILLLLLGGFITHHFETRGNMALYEDESSNFAQHYHDHSIEISLLDEQGLAQEIYLFNNDFISAIKKAGTEAVTLTHTELPFTLQASHYLKNCRPRQVGPVAAGDTPKADGYALFAVTDETADEANFNGCYVNPSVGEPFLLFTGAYNPHVINHEGKNYAIALRKSIWKMPFTIKLDDFNAEFFQNGLPKRFESYIQRIEGTVSNQVKIYMNHPMRYQGYTFFQASWGPQGSKPTDRLFTVFEVVKNPSDQWPLYSILVTTAGLLLHFGVMLTSFILRQTKQKKAQ